MWTTLSYEVAFHLSSKQKLANYCLSQASFDLQTCFATAVESCGRLDGSGCFEFLCETDCPLGSFDYSSLRCLRMNCCPGVLAGFARCLPLLTIDC